MQLTRFTDLGLRVLMYLSSARPADAPTATVGEIAERYEVSHHHLVKVVNVLTHRGWVIATRGKGGGVRLGQAAGEIVLGEVVRLLEGGSELIDCARPPCALRGACHLKDALDCAQAAFFAELDRYTLADVVRDKTGVRLARLNLQPQPVAAAAPPGRV